MVLKKRKNNEWIIEKIFIILLIAGTGEITLPSEGAIQYTDEVFGFYELDEKIEKLKAQ